METSMTQQVGRIRGIEDAVGIQQQLSEAPPGVRGSVSGVQDVPNINNVNGGARSFSEALKIGTAEGVGDTEGAASGNGATVGGATPCVESKDGGAPTTDGGSGITGDDVVKADKANSGSDSDRANDADGVNGGHSVNGVTGAANDGATTGDGIIREGMLEGGFQYPKRTRKRIQGKSTDNEGTFSSAEFVLLPKLFVSNVKNGVSITAIKDWLIHKKIKFVGIYRKSKDHYAHQSFVVTVTTDAYNNVFEESLWPPGVTVREYSPTNRQNE